MFKYLPMIIICIGFATGCTDNKEDSYERQKALRIEGTIDPSFIRRLEQDPEYDDTIIINSSGGRSGYGAQAAWIIKRKRLKVVVDSHCTSACAEYLLPAAKSVTFKNEPLIGFHWNQISIDDYLKDNANRDLEYCDFEVGNDILELWKTAKVNPDFWKETEKRLGQPRYNIKYRENDCPYASIRSYEKILWFPTEKQLRELFRLKFSGNLCADNSDCYTDKIFGLWKRSDNYVVGDLNYNVEDPNQISVEGLQELLDKEKNK